MSGSINFPETTKIDYKYPETGDVGQSIYKHFLLQNKIGFK